MTKTAGEKGAAEKDPSTYTYEKDGEVFINTDIRDENRCEWLFDMPNFLLDILKPHLNDERDIPILQLWYNIFVTVVPIHSAILFYFESTPVWLMVVVVSLTYALYFTRFVLGFHYSSHLPIIKRGSPFAWINDIFGDLLCSFFGFAPGGYHLHHCIMHHIENNQGLDLSATMYYQRDNFFHFLLYWMRHLWLIIVELPKYALTRNRYGPAAKAFLMPALYFAGLYFGMKWKFSVFLTMQVIPYVLTSFFLMFGNWSQHIFVDPDEPFKNTRLAINLVNCFDNMISFNDGYHVVHHENGRLHWTDMPRKFMQNIPRYAQDKAITFQGIGIFHVGIWAMTGQFDKLCKAYVRLPGAPKITDEELTAMFKHRLQKVTDKVKPEGVGKSWSVNQHAKMN